MSAVVRGSRIRIMTAWKRVGLYSALRAVCDIFCCGGFSSQINYLKDKTTITLLPGQVLCLESP